MKVFVSSFFFIRFVNIYILIGVNLRFVIKISIAAGNYYTHAAVYDLEAYIIIYNIKRGGWTSRIEYGPVLVTVHRTEDEKYIIK